MAGRSLNGRQPTSAELSAVEAISPQDPRWTELTAGLDVYFQPAYAQTARGFDPGRALLLYVETDRGEVVLPVVERPIEIELPGRRPFVDWISPYGFSGPAAVRGRADGFLAGLQVLAAERRAVTAFLRCHPLEATHRLLPKATLPPELRRETAAVDLRTDEETLWRRLKPAHRRSIKKAQGARLTTGWLTAPGDFSAFARLYDSTMDRLGAGDYYRLPESYFTGLGAAMAGRCGILAAYHESDDPIAALLLLAGSRYLHYHLGASDQDFLHLRPNHFLFWEAIRHGRRRDLRWLHLGGGRRRDDSLFAFKIGFAAVPFPEHKSCHILNREVYRRLLQARGETDRRDFFPAYRLPESEP